MSASPIRFVCSGCGFEATVEDPDPFRCPQAGAAGRDDIDHVLERRFDPATVPRLGDLELDLSDSEINPFIRFRRLFASYYRALAQGSSDESYVELVRNLDAQVSAIAGGGFTITPFESTPALASELATGQVWVKNETGNVSGSHKARHLMGIAIWLELAADRTQSLAIASCGNAALAAAVVARATDRPLEVFIPPHAEPAIVERLRDLGAQLRICSRETGTSGDPCFLEYRNAVAAGALPFACQGNENGITLEGGLTLAYEMITTLRERNQRLDRLVVQVGGGALASSCFRGFQEAHTLGLVDRLPRLHSVQTAGASPLARAYDRVAERLAERLGCWPASEPVGRIGRAERVERAAAIAACLSAPILEEEMRFAATHRPSFMWPWEVEPTSIATGILDDETYDWLAIVGGMFETGGYPIIVSEKLLRQANELARATTRIEVDPTGSAGLAGCLQLAESGALSRREAVGVLFTGVTRSDKAGPDRRKE